VALLRTDREAEQRVGIEIEVMDASRAEVRHPRGPGAAPEGGERIGFAIEHAHAIWILAPCGDEDMREVRPVDTSADHQPLEKARRHDVDVR